MAVPSIAAVMTMLERLAQRGLAGTGLLFEAFNNKARRQVIPKLDPKSIEVACETMLQNTKYLGTSKSHLFGKTEQVLDCRLKD